MITKNMETNINRNMRLKSMVLKNKIKRLSNDKINFSL
jgi:transcriptional/translational regulatory protein YebC/TACO1